MPRFDFQCQKCHTVFEFERPFGSKKMPTCPACKSKRVEKLISPPNVQFKGTGWYKTDSRPSQTPPPTKKTDAPKVEPVKEAPKEASKKDTKKE